MRGNFASIALIVIGLLALGINLDFFQLDFAALARKWWPLALVALGVAMYFTPEDGKRG